MKITKHLKAIICLILCMATVCSMLISCDTNTESGSETESTTKTEEETQAPNFDYLTNDLSKYISLSASAYEKTSATISADYRIDSEDVQEYIDQERFENRVIQNKGIQVTDKPIKKGDSAFIYYKGFTLKADGTKDKEFSGGSNWTSATPHELVIGSGSFIPGFEDGLVGLIPADTSREAPFDLRVAFPENYGQADLAGKNVIFEIWVVYVVEYEIPEFNEDYIKNVLKFDYSSENITAAYKARVQLMLQDEIKESKNQAIVQEILKLLMEKATIKGYPEEAVNYYYEAYVDQYEYYKQYYEMYGMTFASLDEFVTTYLGLDKGADWKKETRKMAEEVVADNLIFYTIAKQQNLSVTDEDYKKQVQYYIDHYKNQGQEYTAAQIEEGLGKEAITEKALFNKVSEYLVERCTVTYDDKK